MGINIQRFEEKDAKEIVKLIHRAMFETNIFDYSKEDLVKDAENITVSSIIERASWTHFYVFRDEEIIIATGAIGPYWDSLTESSFSLFLFYLNTKVKGLENLLLIHWKTMSFIRELAE